jgi:hypothetical protein
MKAINSGKEISDQEFMDLFESSSDAIDDYIDWSTAIMVKPEVEVKETVTFNEPLASQINSYTQKHGISTAAWLSGLVRRELAHA